MGRAITSLVAFFALKLQVCTSFQRNHAVATPPRLFTKLTDKASATKDPVEREMLEHFLTVECLMYNRGKGLTTWTFEDA